MEEEICFSLRIEGVHAITVNVSTIAAAVGVLNGTIEEVQGRIQRLFWVCHCICREGIPAHCLTAWGDGERSQRRREEIHQACTGAVLGYVPVIFVGCL
jgi:hypothetical protein